MSSKNLFRLYKVFKINTLQLILYFICITILNVISVIENYYYGLVIDFTSNVNKIVFPVIIITLITIGEYVLSIATTFINNLINEEILFTLRKRISNVYMLKDSEIMYCSSGKAIYNQEKNILENLIK